MPDHRLTLWLHSASHQLHDVPAATAPPPPGRWVGFCRTWAGVRVLKTLHATGKMTVAPVVDEAAAHKKAIEEEEAKRSAARAHGHPVTVESFEAWKVRAGGHARGGSG